MLVFVTMQFFNNVSIDKISAFGSVLSGVGTIFAGFIAVYLFNDWREQHNKQVDSDFIMKLYDCLFEMRQLSTQTVGFMRDYLSKQDKNEYGDELKHHNRMLCHLIDYSALKLSDVAYVITTDEYENKFSPQILLISEELHELNDLYRLFLKSSNVNDVPPVYKNLEELTQIDKRLELSLIDLNDKYRSFLVELKKYYKA